jgi:cyclopropane fatty-acyl-phospholipid synthase-like methyltransferase
MDPLQRVKEYYKELDKSYQHWGEEEIYNIHYGFWDEKTKSHIQSLENMNRILAERLQIRPGNKILDAGCGVGASAIWLAKNYDVEVTGITISELQCKKAAAFSNKKASVSYLPACAINARATFLYFYLLLGYNSLIIEKSQKYQIIYGEKV